MDEAAVLTELARLRAGTTVCPGELAKRLGTTPRALRPFLAELEARRVLVVLQRGVVKPLRDVRGPYRIARAPR